MATPAHPACTRQAAGALPRRAGRWWPALLLATAVLAWHAWLVALLAPQAPPAGAPRTGLVQLRSLPAPFPSRQPMPPVAAATPDATRRPGPATRAMSDQPVARPRAATTPRLVDTAAVAPPAPLSNPAADGAPTAASLPAAADSGAGRMVSTTADTADTAVDNTADNSASPAEGQPPPVYPTRVPPPVQLRYALRYNGQAGEALLVWQHDGARYRLVLEGTGLAGRALVAQASEGAFDSHGLAPDRFVDRRRNGPQQAANFRRDTGRIGYSGPAWQHPAWPGAQDRLSWLAQLAAILDAAGPSATPAALQLFITDAHGHAGLWQLQRQPDQVGPAPWGPQAMQHWQREPPRPEGLRTDVWLAAQAGTPAGTWPLRLRFAVPRSGDVFELVLLAAP
jgi:hypothetical protein